MKRAFACAIAACVVAANAHGESGKLGVKWDAVSYPHLVRYQVIQLPEKTVVADDIEGTQVVLDVEGNCKQHAFAVVAVGFPPEVEPVPSMPSAEVVATARPIISGVVFNQSGVHRISGDNFTERVTVLVNGNAVETVNRINCTTVEFPATTGTPSRIEIQAAQPSGVLSAVWTIPPPFPPNNPGIF